MVLMNLLQGNNGDADTEKRLVNTVWEGEGRTIWKSNTETYIFSSVQFSSVAQLCPTLCDPVNRSTPGLPVHHQLPEFTQIHVH